MKNRIAVILATMAFITTSVYGAYSLTTGQTDLTLEGENISVGEITELSKLRRVGEVVYASAESEAEAYGSMFEYVTLIGKYVQNTGMEERLHDMIISGADINKISDVLAFLKTGDYDSDDIENMYERYEEMEDDISYPLEAAYNYATGGRNGVLSTDDVREYMRKGIAVDDIRTANTLSRKGVFTIKEILDMLVEGETWVEILSEVDSELNNGANESLFKMVDVAEGVESGAQMLGLMDINDISGTSDITLSSSITLSESIAEKSAVIDEMYAEKTEQVLSDLGYERPVQLGGEVR